MGLLLFGGEADRSDDSTHVYVRMHRAWRRTTKKQSGVDRNISLCKFHKHDDTTCAPPSSSLLFRSILFTTFILHVSLLLTIIILYLPYPAGDNRIDINQLYETLDGSFVSYKNRNNDFSN